MKCLQCPHHCKSIGLIDNPCLMIFEEAQVMIHSIVMIPILTLES